MSPPPSRRGFLGRLAAAAAGVATVGLTGRPLLQGVRGAEADDQWLAALTGKHRQIFDVPKHGDGAFLFYVRNFLSAYHGAYEARPGEVNAIVGLHGTAIPLAFGDSLWQRYQLGSRFSITDPATHAPAERNPFVHGDLAHFVPPDVTIPALQKQGACVIVCNFALSSLTNDLASQHKTEPAAVKSEFLEGLLPGVSVVPAMVAAFNRAQEHGCTYVYAG